MFKKKTVFILGAGASWHYGYPTGEELVQRMKETAITILRAYYAEPDKNGKTASPFVETYPRNYREPSKFNSLISGLSLFEKKVTEANPLVIDDFLGHNEDIADVGKLLIAMVLLACVSNASPRSSKKDERGEWEPGGDWLRYIVQQLTIDCAEPTDLLANEVTFVTFNYDLSLETGLYWKLANYEGFKKHGVCDDFFSEGRIHHVYGKLYEFDVNRPGAPSGAYNNSRFRLANEIDRAHDAAQYIRTISPSEKVIDQKIVKAIADAEHLYFLGYGFDRRNNALLGLGIRDQSGWQNVYFTNFGNCNKVSKSVERLYVPLMQGVDNYGVSLGSLLGENYQKRSRPSGPGPKFICEKSTKSVYDALAQDFDWPE